MKEKIIVHSLFHPVIFNSVENPGMVYIIADGVWKEVPGDTTYEDIVWFKKPGLGKRSPALEVPNMDFDVEGSKGKVYKVRYSNKKWSCSCEAFTFSGGRSNCKHIKQVLKDIDEGKYAPKD